MNSSSRLRPIAVLLTLGLTPALADEPARGISPAAHPAGDTAQVQAALDAARAGSPLEPQPASARLRAAIERLRGEPAPAGEVFALIKLTDRETGERQIFTRGTPQPGFAALLEQVVPGLVRGESSSIMARDGVEIATRSQLVLPDARNATDEATDGPGETTPELSADEEETLRLQQLNAGSPLPFRIDTDLRAYLEGQPASVPIRVAIDLRGVPAAKILKVPDPLLAGHVWAGLELQAARELEIADRKLSIRRLQEPIERTIVALGGQVHYASWLSGTVEAVLTPEQVLALAAHPAVLRIERSLELRTQGKTMDSENIFWATHQNAFKNHAGYHSDGGHSYTSRVVIGMSERCIRENFPGWRNNSPTSSLRARFYDLDPQGYSLGEVEDCWGDGDDSERHHGHWVASMMVGDFMGGQEPSLPDFERRRRTGSCPECYLVFLQDEPKNGDDYNNRAEALDVACEKGVDIFQSSVGSNQVSCDGSSTLDQEIESLTKGCGVFFVQSAGNNGSWTSDCTTSYPADHPYTFAVGGVDTEEPCHLFTDWFDCGYASEASRGGGNYNGVHNRASIVDLAAPYFTVSTDPDAIAPTITGNVQGTSFASPIVAGLAGRMMDWWKSHVDGWVFNNARMKALMLLFGDRSASFSSGAKSDNDMSLWWGAGRVVLYQFDNRDDWWLHLSSWTLAKKSAVAFDLPLPDDVKRVKAVVWHAGTDYWDEPKIKLELTGFDGCSTGTWTVEESDNKALQYRDVEGCEQVRVRIRNSPVGVSGQRTFYLGVLAVKETSEEDW